MTLCRKGRMLALRKSFSARSAIMYVPLFNSCGYMTSECMEASKWPGSSLDHFTTAPLVCGDTRRERKQSDIFTCRRSALDLVHLLTRLILMSESNLKKRRMSGFQGWPAMDLLTLVLLDARTQSQVLSEKSTRIVSRGDQGGKIMHVQVHRSLSETDEFDGICCGEELSSRLKSSCATLGAC